MLRPTGPRGIVNDNPRCGLANRRRTSLCNAPLQPRIKQRRPVLFTGGAMKTITRRSLIASGAALATGALLMPAEAATGSISLHIVSAGFIVGVSGGSGMLTLGGHRYPLSVGGISAGATIGASGTDLVGTAYHINQPGRHRGHLFGGRGRIVGRRRPVGGATFECEGRRSAAQGPSGRLHGFDRPQRHADFAEVT